MLSRRDVLKAGGALALSPLLPSVDFLGQKPHLRFIHLTDIHIEHELNATEGVRLCVDKILDLKPLPEFIVTGGDHPFDALAASKGRADELFDLFREAMKPLNMPVIHTFGNHDAFGWSRKSLADSNDAEYGKKMFQDRVAQGSTYRSFDRAGWHFILLDDIQPSPSGRAWFAAVDDEQMAWLKNDLSAVGVKTPILVFVHVPIFTAYEQYRAGTLYPGSNQLICANGKQVFDAFKDKNLKAVFQGHTHVIEEIDYAGTKFITAGSVCGEWWRGPRLGIHPEGFSVIDLWSDRLQWAYQPYGWHAHQAHGTSLEP